MTKEEFIKKLKIKLSNFPENEVHDRINFYEEMINDYMEDGMTETEAVEKLGSIDEIVEAIAEEIPLSKIAKKKFKTKKKLSSLNIILLILGFPIWFSLLAALATVVVSLYAALWSVVISLWAVVASCVATSIVGAILFIIYLCTGNPSLGFLLLGVSLILLGISTLLSVITKYLTDFTIKVPKLLFKWIKKLFIVKEE